MSARVARAGPSGPARLRRQRHQDGFHISPRFQPESCAAIMQQIELHVTSAAYKLLRPIFLGPRLVHAPSHDLGIDIQKCEADALREGEIGFPVAACQLVEEDAAYSPWLAAVGQEEIFVAPFAVARMV